MGRSCPEPSQQVAKQAKDSPGELNLSNAVLIVQAGLSTPGRWSRRLRHEQLLRRHLRRQSRPAHEGRQAQWQVGRDGVGNAGRRGSEVDGYQRHALRHGRRR